MDPITAVSFAASILTFIDFGYKIVTGALEIVKSGSTSDNAHTSTVINYFHEIVKPLSEHPPGKSEHEEALKKLAEECKQVSQELVKLLDKLTTNPGCSLWTSARVSLRSMRKKGEVVDLENKLDKYRSQILMRLVLILSERQLSVQVQLSDFLTQVKGQTKQSVDATEKLSDLRDEILEAVEDTLRRIPQLAPPPPQELNGRSTDEIKQDLNEQLRQIEGIRATLDTMLEANIEPSPEMRILKQIYFDSLYMREDVLEKTPADEGTFEWILDEEQENPFLPMDGETKRARLEAKSCFANWMRSGNGVFHISGKAGSGKSTLMKLLLDHEKTQEMLDHWAGGKQLIFAHFFFWGSGADVQRSLEGLHRSILFETLIQFPELIKEIFKRAYKAFSRKKPEDSIDNLFFRPRDFEKAFEDLVSTSPRPGYRICFFIDGLDEYGGDDKDYLAHEHQKLADDLNVWASHGDMKILVSSRPHREFKDTFSDDLRIHLHKLTRHDITVFGRNMFKRHKTFSREDVQSCYEDLVEKVVASCDGVFLWARLAICILLNSIGRDDPLDSLEGQLKKMPDNISKLYEKMFERISSADRSKAFKMLLLIAENKTNNDLNALSITWLNDMEKDPEFPTNCQIKPYADEEISRRHLQAEHQLDGLTKGLLEVADRTHHRSGVKSSYFGKRVVFFHHTVYEFVRQSKILRDFSSQLPKFTSMNTYGRLLLAELWFANSSFPGGDRTNYMSALFALEYPGPRVKLLDAYERAFTHHDEVRLNTHGETEFMYNGYAKTPHGYGNGMIDGVHSSFVHLVATAGRHYDAGYVEGKVKSNPDLLRSQGELSLLLSAATTYREHTTLKALLDTGASPHDRVKVLGHESREHTVWQIFCTFLVAEMVAPVTMSEPHLSSFYKRLEYFLAAGVDPNCFILLIWAKLIDVDLVRGFATHVISLKDLVKQLNPPNMVELSKLMDKCGLGSLDMHGEVWKSDKEGSESFKPEHYAPFSLDMQPALPGYDERGTHFNNSSAEWNSEDKRWYERYERFCVHSVVWRNAKLFAPGLKIRCD